MERPAAKARGVADLLELSNPNAKILVQGKACTIAELIDKSIKVISILDKHTRLLSSTTSTIFIASEDTHIAILLDIGAMLIGLKTVHINPNDNISTALLDLERKGAQISAIVADDKVGALPTQFNGVLCAFTKKIPPNFGLNFIKLDLEEDATRLFIEKSNREPSTAISYVFSNNNIFNMNNKVCRLSCLIFLTTFQNVTAGVYSLLSTIPFVKKPVEGDTIVTDEPLSSALGRSLLYAAIFSGGLTIKVFYL